MDTLRIKKLFEKTNSSNDIHESVVLIQTREGDTVFCGEYHRDINTPILMASITKLFTTACIYRMLQDGLLHLDDKIVKYIPEGVISRIHCLNGVEYSYDLTIENLLSQTSGLPDFYLDGKDSFFERVKQADFSYSFEQEMDWIKELKPRFKPGRPRKAYYTDSNFTLLGKVIESINGSSLQDAFNKYIFKPLNLKRTYLVSNDNDYVPHTYLYKEKIERPLFIRSNYAGGGGVTTTKEMMEFLRSFWNGDLFNKSLLAKLSHENQLQLSFFPIKYSMGYMALEASFPFGEKIHLAGHSGSTGSFAFYCPQKEIFLVGDFPQIAYPSLCIRFVMKSALLLKKNQ